MELKIIWRVVVRYWWLILLPVVVTALITVPALIGASGAASGGFNTVIVYSAAQQLDAIPNREGDYQDVWLASELTVNALTAWVQSNSYRSAIAEQTAAQGLEIDPQALPIVGDNERSVGQIFISWRSAEELDSIADAAITVLRERNQEYFAQLGGEPAEVTILQEPEITPAPPPLTNRLEPIIRLVIALGVGVGLAFLAHYLDPTLRRHEDVEALGVPVIGSIPR